jgi:hypothetical protein
MPTTRELQLDAGGEGTTVTITNAGGATYVQQVTPGTGGTIQYRAAAAEGTSPYGIQLKNGTNAACIIRTQTDVPATPLWYGISHSGPIGTYTAEVFTVLFRSLTASLAQLRWQTDTSCRLTDPNGTVVGTILPAGSDPTLKYQWRFKLENVTTGAYTLKVYSPTGVLLNTLSGTRTWSNTTTPAAMQFGIASVHSQLLTVNADHTIYSDDTTEPAVYVQPTAALSGTGTLSASGSGGAPAASLSGTGTLTAGGAVPVDPNGLAVPGDSLTYQGGPGNGDGGWVETSLAAVGWDPPHVQVDGLISREIYNTGVTPTTKTVIDTWRANGFNPKNFLMPLGTNGSNDTLAVQKTKINAILDVVAQGTTGVYKVWWPTITWQDTTGEAARIATFRQAITEVAAARTDVQVVVIDYDALLHNGRDESALWSGSPHMTSTGYALRNSIIASQLQVSATGTANLSGSGTLSAAATPRPAGVAALSGSGSLSASGAPAVAAGTAVLSGTGTLAAAGGLTSSGPAALSGNGVLTVSATPRPAGSAALSGAGTLSATGNAPTAATAALSGNGVLTAAGLPALARAAALSGIGTLTALGIPTGIPTTRQVKVWTGTAWVPEADVWTPSGPTGSPPPDGPLKVWSGSRWVSNPRRSWVRSG